MASVAAMVGALALTTGLPASAAPGDGVVQVRVVQDAGALGWIALNTSGADEGQQTANGIQMNPPLIGTTVTITDAAGDSATATTNNQGIVTFTPSFLSGAGLSGSQYRVDVANPKPGTFYPGFAANGQTVPSWGVFTDTTGGHGSGFTISPVTQADLAAPDNEKLSSNTEFVDVSGGANAYVNTSFWYPSNYAQQNAPVVDAAQPWDAPPLSTSNATDATLFSTTYHLDSPITGLAQVGSVAAGDGGDTTGTGAVYGIAYDRTHQRIYSAAYAKRGSAYGPAGSGGIYVTNLTSTSYPLAGTTTVFATVPDAGTATHDMATNGDYGFFNVPGTQSLGDIDVTTDDHYLFGVNENNGTVFVYDLAAADPASTIQTYPIPNPCTTAADWHPMGAGVGLETSFVGGICSPTVTPTTTTTAEMDALTAHVYTFDPATGAFGAQVVNQSLAYPRGLTTSGFPCGSALPGDNYGRWFPWISSYPVNGVANAQSATGCGLAAQIGWATPMLGDIAQETNGDLVLSFRGRFADQGGWNAMEPTQDGSFSPQGGVVGDGDVVRGCKLAGSQDYVLDPNYDPATMTLAPGSVCTNNNVAGVVSYEPNTFREFYAGDVTYPAHQEASYSGIALSRSEPTVISDAVDPNTSILTQGIHAIERDGLPVSGLTSGIVETAASIHFQKGMGIADLEVLAEPAPIQIGNRVWLDANGNGLQDAGEPGIAGVTVNLYDANGNKVGTTTTNADGQYYFDDSDVPGGLSQNTDYTIKLDNPDDYTGAGPLVGDVITQADAGNNDQHDSDGTIPDGATFSQTTLTTGGAGQDNHTYDFGFIKQPVSIGDKLWIDSNGDGIQDAGEPGVPDATVTLLDSAGQPVATTTTDDVGNYSFPNLPPDTDYTVKFPTTVTVDGIDYSLTQPTADNSTTANDSNPDQSTGDALVTTPSSGSNATAPGQEDNPTIDAGYVANPVSIGDRLWIDSNGDGIQGAGEPAVPDGTTVQLINPDTGDVVATTTTTNGYYSFTNLPPNTDYTVKFPTSVTVGGIDYSLTQPTSDGSTTANDSNPDQTTGEASVTTPKSGQDLGTPNDADNPTIDAGYAPPSVSIGDRLWLDSNGDGIQGAGEPAVPDGTTVQLINPDTGDVVATTTTDNGYYSFTNLLPNTHYTVKFPTSVTVDGIDYSLTQPTSAGSTTANDSNPDQATGEASVTTPATGGNSGAPNQADNPTIDAGYVANPVSIGDRLWIDSNGDGIQDSGEPAVPDGTTVQLINPGSGDVVATTTTTNGYYSFTNLPPNTDYTVKFPTTVQVDGVTYELTPPAADGSTTANDSNPDQGTGEASVTTPKSGEDSGAPNQADNPTIDAGYMPQPVSIGDYVWLDSNHDGLQQPDEPVVPGATVTLLDGAGHVVATTTTDGDGYYSFTGLAPNTPYTVQFPTQVTVDGVNYSLTQPKAAGSTAANDSNPDQSTGKAPVTTPGSGLDLGGHNLADNPTIDAGYVAEPVSVGDYLWIDSNHDGIQDAGEPPVPGATVQLLDANGQVVATTTTNPDGYYAFTDLSPDTDYTVQFPKTVTVGGIDYALTTQNTGMDTAKDSNPSQTTGKAAVTTPKAGENLSAPGKADNPTIDAGYYPKPVSIGDYLWIDSNGDGTQQTDEPPVPGATVTLLDSAGEVVATTTTSRDGYYSFTGLEPNMPYVVKFPTTVTVDGVGYVLTQQGVGDASADSNPNQSTGQAPVTTPKSGEDLGGPNQADNPTIDAGYVLGPVSIGDKLWIDTNGNGVQDKGEPPVSDVPVQLIDSTGSVVATATTDSDGNYSFTDLPPDTKYTVRFPTTVTVAGVDYSLTKPGQGSNSQADSKPDQSTGDAVVVTPKSGSNSSAAGQQDNPAIDAGYVLVPVTAPTTPPAVTIDTGLGAEGGQPDWGLIGGGIALLVVLAGGAASLLVTRRRRPLR